MRPRQPSYLSLQDDFAEAPGVEAARKMRLRYQVDASYLRDLPYSWAKDLAGLIEATLNDADIFGLCDQVDTGDYDEVSEATSKVFLTPSGVHVLGVREKAAAE